MGVLACDRRGCNNVMCDRLSHRYGYICNDCFEQLVSLGPSIDIEEFMDGDHVKEVNREISYKYFAHVFPDMINDDF